MVNLPGRILCDTNVFILGHLEPDSPEGRILGAIANQSSVALILSNELIEQIRRVARRVGGKDWTGLLLNRLWQDYSITYVNVTTEEKQAVETAASIPREDIGIYVTAVRGKITRMVSSNHEFVQQTAKVQNLFECLTPVDFVEKYLS